MLDYDEIADLLACTPRNLWPQLIERIFAEYLRVLIILFISERVSNTILATDNGQERTQKTTTTKTTG